MDKILSRTSWEEIRAFRTSHWVLQFLGIFVHTLFLFHDHKQAFMRTLYLLYILATIYSSMSCLGLCMSLTHWRLNFHNFRFWNFSNSPSREKKNLFSPKICWDPSVEFAAKLCWRWRKYLPEPSVAPQKRDQQGALSQSALLLNVCLCHQGCRSGTCEHCGVITFLSAPVTGLWNTAESAAARNTRMDRLDTEVKVGRNEAKTRKERQENCGEGETQQILDHPSPSSAAPHEPDAADRAQAR